VRGPARFVSVPAYATVLVFAVCGRAAPAEARPGVDVDARVLERLASQARRGGPALVPGFPLDGGREVTLSLEPFQVFAPDAVIIERSGTTSRRVPLPSERYLIGRVVGEAESFAMLAVGSSLRGLIGVGHEIYEIGDQGDSSEGPRRSGGVAVRRVDPELDRPPHAAEWRCELDRLSQGELAAGATPVAAGQPQLRATASDAVYAVRVAIDTDWELYEKLGSSEALAAYVADLVAATSAIYLRDVKSVLQVAVLYTYATPEDPWEATSTMDALLEVGTWWHDNHPEVNRTTVHFLSGKSNSGMRGGIAWLRVLCRSDFAWSGGYGGGYGVSASLAGRFSTTNPSLYWDLLCFSHELGHNFGSSHTHCYDPPVDTCYSGEDGCYSGTVSVPAEKGTIMSYCHLRSGGYSNIKLFLGVPGEASEAVTDVIRTYVESRAGCLTTVDVAPSVISISPDHGSEVGGTSVTITGTNFQDGAIVRIAGVAATGVTVHSGEVITAVTGSTSPRTGDVEVTNPDLQVGLLAAAFTYMDCSQEVSERVFSGSDSVISCGTIVAGPSVTLQPTADVVFRAASGVMLKNGFVVAGGAAFTVAVDASLAAP